MATLLENRQWTYQVVFNKMSVELTTIRKDDVFECDMDALIKMQLYWNELVRTATHWKSVAERELTHFMDIKRIKRYLKEKLLNECTILIDKIDAMRPEKCSAMIKQKELLEELRDRLIYIKKTF